MICEQIGRQWNKKPKRMGRLFWRASQITCCLLKFVSRRCTSGDGRDVFWRVHLHLFSRCLACVQELFKVWKKTPLWKVSYEECSLFETSTTQTPILSRIESLAVHINTFQAQIKKCKQNKKIYIYIIFPLSKGFKSQCSKSFWTQNLRSTLFK